MFRATVSVCAAKWNQPSRIGSLLTKFRPHPRHATTMQACDCESRVDRAESRDVETPYANVNWDDLGFNLTSTDYLYVMNCSKEDQFSQGTLTPFGNMLISPSSGVLNYGQGLLEGLKAYRTEDERLVLFRPEENGLRMNKGAERLCMRSPTVDQFVEAVKQTVIANKRWVPPPGKGSMYIRPLLLGSGAKLGVGPSTEYTFISYASPVGNYHEGVLNLVVEEQVFRAAPGGTGGIKSITNYSSIYKAITEAKAKGYSDVLFLDAVNRKYIEEASTSNIFLVKGNVISTPPTHGTILPGVTRKSIIQIAHLFGYKVEERCIQVEELFEAEEVFCTGTAVVVNPVTSITFQDRRIYYKTGGETVSQKLYEILTGIQTGRLEDKMGWTVYIN